MKGFMAGVGCFTVLVAFVALMIGSVALGWGVSWVTAPFRGAIDARETIQADGNFRIAAYTKFYNDCASIQMLENEMDAQLNLLLSTKSENERRVVQANLAGIEGARTGAISRYNTESHKQWTIAQFKSESLAYELPTPPYLTFNQATETWQKGAKTVCVVD